jgi:hypothetical protein
MAMEGQARADRAARGATCRAGGRAHLVDRGRPRAPRLDRDRTLDQSLGAPTLQW